MFCSVSVPAGYGKNTVEAGEEVCEMVVLAVVLLGGLFALAGLSVYSALMLSKRTDEIVTLKEEDDEAPSGLVVRFPDSVFRPTGFGR